MLRSVVLAGAAAAAVATVTVPSVPVDAAPVGQPVVIVAHTDFTVEASEFDSTLDGCESGTVINSSGGPHFTPKGGTYAGLKEFTCDDGESGFSIRLTARFGPNGSTGTWTLADGWGDFAGLKGSGSLVGIISSDTIIDDTYTGTVR